MHVCMCVQACMPDHTQLLCYIKAGSVVPNMQVSFGVEGIKVTCYAERATVENLHQDFFGVLFCFWRVMQLKVKAFQL